MITDVRSMVDALRLKRQRLGITQRDLAARIGVVMRTLVMWENHHNRPRLNLAEAWLDALAMPHPPDLVLWWPSADCGTTAGYQAHRSRGEETCTMCRKAWSAYVRERRPRVEVPKPECGTLPGYRWHGKKRETPCLACGDAYNAYRRELRRRKKAGCPQAVSTVVDG